MDKVWLSLLVGVLGGAGGALAVDALGPRGDAAEAAAGPDGSALREVRERLASIEARLDRPVPALAAPDAGSGAAGGPASAPSPEAIEAIAVRAAERALAKSREGEAAAAAPRRREERKRAPLSEVAREMGLTSAQEEDLRRIYAERVERYLKLMTEPDGDPEALRRELDESRNDPGKKMAIGMRLLPKYLSKMNDAMALEAETASKVSKVLGPEGYRRYTRSYEAEESDPFGIGGSFRIDAGGEGG